VATERNQITQTFADAFTGHMHLPSVTFPNVRWDQKGGKRFMETVLRAARKGGKM
jgi:hypothetical protein